MQQLYEALSPQSSSRASPESSALVNPSCSTSTTAILPCHASSASLSPSCRTATENQYHRSASALFVSASSIRSDNSSAIIPMCRICHMPEEPGRHLISPCRCCGTLRHVHSSCLMKWIEISSRKRRNKPPQCEICQYLYRRHKQFKFRSFRLPRISRCDKILHTIFFLTILTMIGCAVATVLCFLSDKDRASEHAQNPEVRVKLTPEEIVTLTCGVTFFVAFFVAMSVQIKAKRTIYQLAIRFVRQNLIWTIESYERSLDYDYKGPPVAV